MYRCIECMADTPTLISQTISLPQLKKCINTTNPHVVDKYLAYSNTILLIDLLLQKKEVLRHIIFNTDSSKKKLFQLLALIIFCLFTYKFHNSNDFDLLFKNMNLILFFLKYITKYLAVNYLKYLAISGYIEFYVYWKAIAISSYYYFLLPLLILWNCNETEYYNVIFGLSEVSNMIAILASTRIKLIKLLLLWCPIYYCYMKLDNYHVFIIK